MCPHRLAAPGLIALVALLATSTAHANHIPGATYTGTHAAGTIWFTVSADGERVSSYRIDVKGDTCAFVAEGDETEGPGPAIVDGAFVHHPIDGLLLEGAFPAVQSASGVLRLFHRAVAGVKPACDTGTLGWTATTTATPPPAPAPGVVAPGDGPAGTPPGPPPPAALPPGAPVHRTTVLLRTRDRKRLTGQVRSTGAGCTAGRTVALKRGSRTLSVTQSNALGYFRFKRTKAMRGQRIRVVVSARSRPALLCATGSSRTVRLPKR